MSGKKNKEGRVVSIKARREQTSFEREAAKTRAAVVSKIIADQATERRRKNVAAAGMFITGAIVIAAFVVRACA